jgi:uncharacterized cupin superfamily protein
MSDRSEALRSLLVRNFHDIGRRHEHRPPLYDTRCASLAAGTAARKLGIGVDTLAPGMRSCLYHFHHARRRPSSC